MRWYCTIRSASARCGTVTGVNGVSSGASAAAVPALCTTPASAPAPTSAADPNNPRLLTSPAIPPPLPVGPVP
ncbi:hypothetical protein GCM10018783_54490 [Streptomyces griseosporeus]|nr:hypothetical protein GCM10018783_54490 [Streptomyces griseosporeus]